VLARPVRALPSALLPLVRADMWADNCRRGPASGRLLKRAWPLLRDPPTNPTNPTTEMLEGMSEALLTTPSTRP
jgi:hypothetical protein